MTPKARVECVLRGGVGETVPFTMYENKIPQCVTERLLRNRGLCIVKRDVPAFKTHRPGVRTTQRVFSENGKKLVETCHETPSGTLTLLEEPLVFTSWTHRHLFKTPDDYRALRAFIAAERYEPNYAEFSRAQADFGEDAIFRAGFGLEPLQALISGQLMDMQTFCMEWMENRDEILKLYALLVEQRRQVYGLVAESPALIANYGGNVVVQAIGPKVFEQYYLPHYDEAAEVMHRHGKLIGCHFDAHCKQLSALIARTKLDYIEAFTPTPDTDMTLAEARAAWPDKVLWINFPSSFHLHENAAVERTAVNLLHELDRVDGVIMGITEDMPPERWQGSCRAILDGLERHARERPEAYRGSAKQA